MISSGMFKIDENILREIIKKYNIEIAKKILWEMLNWGGRLSIHEYEYWLKKLKELKNQKSF